MKRAETLQEIQQVTSPEPLEGEALQTFYVQTDAARDDRYLTASVLRRHLQDPPPLHLLFASHPGAGKSTELNRLIAEAGQDYWFVRFSARDELELRTLTHIDLILAMMETLYKAGQQEKLIHDKRVIEPVRGWLREVVRETKWIREEELEVEAGVGIDGLLAQIVGMMAKLRSGFRLGHETAETVRQALRPRIADLRQYCNQVLVEITIHLSERAPGRRLLLIVEDTDKLDVEVAQNVFVDNASLLADLQGSIIYTVPLFLIHAPDYNRLKSTFKILTLPMIKTHTSLGTRFQPGIEVLGQVVSRRLDVDKLLEPGALDLAIEKTGGILRELLSVINEASITAQDEGQSRISVETIRYTLDRLKTAYYQSVRSEKGESAKLYEKMKDIAKAPLGKVPPDDTLQLLLYTQAVIEYNGRGWYDLHPLMRENLQEMGYLNVVAR